MKREDLEKVSLGKINDLIDIHIMKDYMEYANDYPNWSGDISAAWKVVEKLSEEYRITLYKLPGGKWSCKFSDFPQVIESDAPEAIAKSALLTVLEASQ